MDLIEIQRHMAIDDMLKIAKEVTEGACAVDIISNGYGGCDVHFLLNEASKEAIYGMDINTPEQLNALVEWFQPSFKIGHLAPPVSWIPKMPFIEDLLNTWLQEEFEAEEMKKIQTQ